MDFDKLKENNGVYLYQDNSFNTITVRLNFLLKSTNRDSAISDLLCYYLAVTNKNFKTDDEIMMRSKELYSLELYFYNKLYSKQRMFGLDINLISPEAVNDDYYKEAFEFIRQMLMEPDFTNEEMLELVKRNYLASRRIDLSNNEEYAETMYSQSVLYEKDRKYNYSTDMRYISKMINSITLDDLKKEYEYMIHNFHSGFVFGNMEEEKFNEFVSFMELERTKQEVSYDRSLETKEGDIELKKDCEQSYIYVTYDMDKVDYSKLRLLNKMLNSSLGLCYQILREKYGLVYSSSASILYYLKKMYFYGEIDKDKKDKFVEAVDEIVELLKDKEMLAKFIEIAKREMAINELYFSENQERMINSLNDYVLGLYEGLNRTEVNKQIQKIDTQSLIGSTLSLKRKNVFMVRGGEDE